MNKLNFKIIKVLGFSILSFVIYFIITNSEKINLTLQKIQESKSSRGFGIYLTINLVKWFLLIFGIISLVMVGKELVNNKQR